MLNYLIFIELNKYNINFNHYPLQRENKAFFEIPLVLLGLDFLTSLFLLFL